MFLTILSLALVRATNQSAIEDITINQMNPIDDIRHTVSYREGSLDEMAAGLPPRVVMTSESIIELLCPICAQGGKPLSHNVIDSSICDYKICDDCVKQLRRFRGICPNCRKKYDYSKFVGGAEEAKTYEEPVGRIQVSQPRRHSYRTRDQPRLRRPVSSKPPCEPPCFVKSLC